MFPARAGMSRELYNAKLAEYHVPRASGDEPLQPGHITKAWECSPRERG